jgi:integrase
MTTAMKVSDYMQSLAKRLQEDRKIAESTATQYLQTLHKLNNSKPFNNLAWAKKFDEVQKVIDTYAPSTQGNQYMVLASALSTVMDKSTYKSAYNHWRDKMMEARKERNEKPANEKSEKQEENWLSWEDVTAKKNALKEDISHFVGNKHLTPSQYDKLLQFLVISLYTDIQPRRNQDYLDMFVVKRLPKNYDKTKNYYDIATQRFIFNKYKTAKKHGEQIESVPDELRSTLRTYLSHHPLRSSKELKLLVKHDGSPLNTVNSITRILNRIFGKKAGSSMLRHSFLSSKYGDMMKQLESDTNTMGNTPAVAISDYIKY